MRTMTERGGSAGQTRDWAYVMYTGAKNMNTLALALDCRLNCSRFDQHQRLVTRLLGHGEAKVSHENLSFNEAHDLAHSRFPRLVLIGSA